MWLTGAAALAKVSQMSWRSFGGKPAQACAVGNTGDKRPAGRLLTLGWGAEVREGHGPQHSAPGALEGAQDNADSNGTTAEDFTT